MVEIDQRQLDADEFLLNTPSATYDLRIGLPSAHEHTPADFVTKQTTVDPSDDGMVSGRTPWRPSSAVTTSSSIMFRRSLAFPLSGRSVSKA